MMKMLKNCMGLLLGLVPICAHGSTLRLHPRELQVEVLPRHESLLVLKNIDGLMPLQKRAVIIGASSGMGNALAKRLLADGYLVGVAARSFEPLKQLQTAYGNSVFIKPMDASKPEEAVQKLNELIQEMGGMDLCVYASTGYYDQKNPSAREWDFKDPVLAVDVVGFSAITRTAINFFETQGSGHFVGFSSVDGYRGTASCPVYSAAKAYITRFLEAERNHCMQNNIPVFVTELVPGWVNARPQDNYGQLPSASAYWVDTLDDAIDSIYKAIQEKKSVAYVTERQEKVVDLLKTVPEDLYNALSARPGGRL